MKVAFGEQDSSLWLFQWMIQNKVMSVVQPDLNYSGGFIRAARVARMARQRICGSARTIRRPGRHR